MNEYEKRKQAIQRHLTGESVTTITKSLGKSRQWLYNWLERYKAGNTEDWFCDHSRAPHHVPSKVDAAVEQQVIEVRLDLERQRIAQIGAIAISYELRRRGIDPPPVWTINRIIARHGLVGSSPPRHRSGKDYPELFAHTHQLDLVGPRRLKGDGRFWSVNIIDICSRTCLAVPKRTKASRGITQSIADYWSLYGLPDALQMDNELAMRGSNRHPRSFGHVVRFALALGVAPVFIPNGEPWRNGIIERFNNTYDKRFYQAEFYQGFEHLCQASKAFSLFHNANHRYSSLGHQTPNQARRLMLPASLYDGRIDLSRRIPLTEGDIYFVRFIRSDLKLHLHTESFPVDPRLIYSYVVGQISVENHCLHILQDDQVIHTYPYTMPVDW